MEHILDAALWYLREKQWAVIPIAYLTKLPTIPWTPYQKKLPEEPEVKEWFKDNSVGGATVTGQISGCTVIDWDSYKENAFPFEANLPDQCITPISETPTSGKQYWFKYCPNLPSKNGILPGLDIKNDAALAIFPPSWGKSKLTGERKQYRWIISPQECELAEIPDALLELILNISKYKRKESPLLQPVTSVTSCDIWEHGTRDENLFHIANCLIKTRNDEDYVRQTLMAITKSWGETDERWINAKIQSALKRVELKNENLHREVEQWVSVASGDFSIRDCYNELLCVTKDSRNTVRQAIHRLKEHNIIDKVGNRNGYYRLKNVVCEKIDFINADTTPYLVKWPMNVHELVTLYSRSLIVIAGSPQAGKTAFLLNTAWKNKDNFNIQYFSSEMWDAELKIRLLKFPHDLKDWGKINFQWKTQNFQDSIDPDGFNIIDYLTVNKDFFEIAGLLDEIFCSLKSGIAVVAIQKPKGRDIGVGGERTLDKARLYLAIQSGELKIIKGKIWACDEINPDEMRINFKLGGGYHFKTEGPWKHL